MNFFVFYTVVVLIAIQGAYAIKCYKCQPESSEFANVKSKEDFKKLNLCSKPTDTVDCSENPNIGSRADACYTARVTMNISLLNIGEVTYHVQDCGINSYCSDLKKITCDTFKKTFSGISGFGISDCDASCCEEDLCNNPSSSVKNITPNTTIFGLLGLAVAFMGMF